MTLADRIHEILLVEPLPECALATELRKRRCDVRAALETDTRFRHNGLKARASRWTVGEDLRPETEGSPGFTIADLAAHWGWEAATVETIVFGDEGLVEKGFMESVNGNGLVRVTNLGLQWSRDFVDLGTW